MPGDLHHRADHAQHPGLEVEGVVHQPRDLTPAQTGAGGGGD